MITEFWIHPAGEGKEREDYYLRRKTNSKNVASIRHILEEKRRKEEKRTISKRSIREAPLHKGIFLTRT